MSWKLSAFPPTNLNISRSKYLQSLSILSHFPASPQFTVSPFLSYSKHFNDPMVSGSKVPPPPPHSFSIKPVKSSLKHFNLDLISKISYYHKTAHRSLQYLVPIYFSKLFCKLLFLPLVFQGLGTPTYFFMLPCFT